jgi:excinuclease UvrABC ATPase subunit
MFKNFLLPILIIIAALSYYGFFILDGKHAYVGTKTCSMCHKKDDTGAQYAIWEASRHAQAYKTLQSEAADDIAKERGFTTKAAETEACLKCHVSGYNIDAALLSDKFSMADGVQCETCHGPGSAYKTKKIMESRKLSVENGLIVFEKTEELCTGCHNEESPSFKGFNFEEMWDKIKHPNPKRLESKL